MFNGYTAEQKIENVEKCHIRVLVKSTTGNKYIEMDSTIPKEGYITPYISYPDSRATNMEVWIKYNDGTKRYISMPLVGSENSHSRISFR